MSKPECDEYIRIFKYSNIFDPNIYSDIRSYQNFDTNIFRYSFVTKFWSKIIKTFIYIRIWIQIYSDIRSYQKCSYEYIRIFLRVIFFDTNIFGYSFISKSTRMSHSVLLINGGKTMQSSFLFWLDWSGSSSAFLLPLQNQNACFRFVGYSDIFQCYRL